MFVLKYLFLTLGGVTLFLLGLKSMSENMQQLSGNKMQKVIKTFTKNRVCGVFSGAVSTELMQSSIATNVIVTSFVSSGILSLSSGCAVIMGANIGTTITAQLVSLSGSSGFDMAAIGSLVSFIGFLISFSKDKKLECVGGVMAGFGMLFLGLNVISDSIVFFKDFNAFRNFFLVDNKLLLFLNGIIITALVQSSSAVTSVIIILATNGLLGFENSMFLILGSNIGSCVSVIIASLSKNQDGRSAAYFNLFFNLIGSLALIIPLSIYSSEISCVFMSFSSSIERAIANFHTLFNVFVTLIIMPVLTPIVKFITIIVGDNKVKQSKLEKGFKYV